MMKRYYLQTLLCALVWLTGCSDNLYENYPGLWELQGANRLEVIEITRQGEAFMLNNAVLKGNAGNNNGKDVIALAKVEGQLSFNHGLGNVYLVLPDENTLHISKQRFARITPARVEELKAAQALQEQTRRATVQQAREQQEQERNMRQAQMREREAERAQCQQLIDQINADTAAIKIYASNNAKWTAEYEKIKQKYTEKAKQYPNCKPDFF